MSLLKVEGLTRTFRPGDAPAVDDVGFEVGSPELFALLGPSGCGKTTTLRLVAGFEPADRGRVLSREEVLHDERAQRPPEERPFGFVFQEFAIFPHLSVLENVAFGLHRLPRAERAGCARRTLATVGLAGLDARRPHELSVGQQQRVAIARALAPDPQLLLLDEPFSNLDARLRREMLEEVRRLLEEHGRSAVLVTHDQEEALAFADRLGVMREGRLLQTGTPEEVYRRPRSSFVAEFLGRTNLLDLEAEGEHAPAPFGPLRLDAPAQGRVRVSLRPEHLRPEPPRPSGPTGTVLSRAFRGHDVTLRVGLADHTFTVLAGYDCPFRAGESVALVPREPGVVLHDEDTGPAGGRGSSPEPTDEGT